MKTLVLVFSLLISSLAFADDLTSISDSEIFGPEFYNTLAEQQSCAQRVFFNRDGVGKPNLLETLISSYQLTPVCAALASGIYACGPLPNMPCMAPFMSAYVWTGCLAAKAATITGPMMRAYVSCLAKQGVQLPSAAVTTDL